MKKYILSITAIIVLCLVHLATIANAAPTSTTVQNLIITGVKTAPCLKTDGTGLVASTSCGSGGASTTIIFLANGTAFVTTSTINFQAGTNVTITTSTNGTYTISASGGGSSGGVASSSPFTAGLFAVVVDGNTITGTSTVVQSLANNSASGGIDFSKATGTAITAVLHSLNISQFTNNSGFITSAPATNTLIARGTATGPAITFATSTATNKWDISCATATCTFTIPPANDTYFAPSTTIPTNDNQLTNGAGYTTNTGTVTTSSAGSINSLPIWTSASALGNSTISQAGGATLLNGVAFLDGGGDFIGPNIFINGAGSLITQNTTGTTAVGNFVQGGGVTTVNTTTTLSGAQFCGGGLFNVQNTTGSITVTTPTTSTIASSPCGSSIYTGSFSQQFLVNNSTNTVFVATNGSGESQLFSPATPSSLAPGQEYFITGQFENSATVQGATSTGTTFVVKYSLYQSSTVSYITGAGAYLGISGTNLTVSSTLASSSVTFILNATTTDANGGRLSAFTSGKQALQTISCFDSSGAGETSTITVYYNTTFASSGIQQVVVPALTCGIAGNTTTTFSIASIPAGAYTFVDVTSTAVGNSTLLTTYISAQKQ